MPSLSKHITALRPSATLEINAESRKLKNAGHKIWNFSVGEPDFRPPEEAVGAATHSLHNDPIRYGSAGGGLPLRTAIAHKLKKENHLAVDLDQIVCGVGAKQLLYHLMHALLNPGDEVVVHKPYWTSYGQQILSAQGKLVDIPYFTEAEDPLDPDYIDGFITAKTKALILCSPNNPAGYVLKPASLKALAHYLAQKDLWIISDEIYEYFAFDHPHSSVYNHCEALKDRYIHINGISKSYAMTGWRVGYMAAPKPVAKLVKTLISHSSTCLPTFVEKAAHKVIEGGPRLMKDRFASLKQKRDLAVSLLSGIPSVTWVKPEGAFYLFLDVRKPLAHSEKYAGSTTAMALELLHQHHVTVVAGEAFGCPGFLRVSYACSTADLRGGLGKLKRFLLDL